LPLTTYSQSAGSSVLAAFDGLQQQQPESTRHDDDDVSDDDVNNDASDQ